MANVEPEDRNGIDFYYLKGSNILLIAPHAVDTKPYDDIATAELARQIRENLKCSAIINTTYRKPTGKAIKKRNGGIPSFEADVLNLNLVNQAEKHPYFINSLKEVAESDGLTYAFWIHGVADKNIKEGVDCLIGYGQPNEGEEEQYTAKEDVILNLIKQFDAQGIKAVKAPAGSIYRGWKKSYMNQWFRLHYGLDKIQSIQLEFKKTGFRKKEDIQEKAKIIARAISVLVPKPDTITAENVSDDKVQAPELNSPKSTGNTGNFKNTKDVKESGSNQFAKEVPSAQTGTESLEDEVPTQDITKIQKMTDTDDRTDTIDVGESDTKAPAKTNIAEVGEKEDSKIEKAYQHLRDIFKKHISHAMLECGQYLIQAFYDGDYRLAQEKKFTKNKSLSKLIKRIQQDAIEKGDAPSRTWIFDAVNLAIDNNSYKLGGLPSAYGQLGHSHKVNLTYFKYTPKTDEDEKKQNENTKKYFKTKKDLVEETVREKHSVARLRERIKEEKQQLGGDNKAINIFNLPSKELLMKESNETLNDLQTQSRTKINYHSNTLKKAKLAGRRIKKAIETQKPTPAQLRQAIKNNEWTIGRNNVNFQTGCSNACIYCYGRFMFNAQRLKKEAEEQGKKFEWGKPKRRGDDVDKNYGLKDGRVGFPTSHDITSENLDDYLTVLGKLLRAGNKIIIITKPRLECIKAICEASAFFKDEILFRFTIGGKSEGILKFWEPGAPTYEHRLKCLKYAYDAGFQTSVSIEPLLEYDKVQKMVEEMLPYTTDAIWFGKMSQISDIKKRPEYKIPDGRLKDELEKVEAGHSDENIKALYEIYKDNPKIKWKLAYKDVLGIPLPPAPGMDI